MVDMFELIVGLKQKDIHLSVKGGKLEFECAVGAMTEDIKSLIRSNRHKLIEHLNPCQTPENKDEDEEEFDDGLCRWVPPGERAEIQEADYNLREIGNYSPINYHKTKGS